MLTNSFKLHLNYFRSSCFVDFFWLTNQSIKLGHCDWLKVISSNKIFIVALDFFLKLKYLFSIRGFFLSFFIQRLFSYELILICATYNFLFLSTFRLFRIIFSRDLVNQCRETLLFLSRSWRRDSSEESQNRIVFPVLVVNAQMRTYFFRAYIQIFCIRYQ